MTHHCRQEIVRFISFISSGHPEKDMVHWFIPSPLGGAQSTQRQGQMEHAHFPKSNMAWAAWNEMEPAASKSENPDAICNSTRNAICTPGW